MATKKLEITIGHTPDADDAFMFYALTAELIKSPNFKIKHKLTSIQNLNDAAQKGTYEMSALSFAAYPECWDRYLLMDCGACMGYKFGPILLAKKPASEDKVMKMKVAIPGILTTAYWLLKMFCPTVHTIVLPNNEIVSAIQNGSVDAGLVIDSNQMTYTQNGLYKIVDLGQWWYDQTKLPLPLGGNIVRQDLSQEIIDELTDLFRQSIKYALANRSEAVKYAMRFAQDMSEEQAQKFIGRYVNEFTIDYGVDGHQALKELFTRASYVGIFDRTKPQQKAKES